MNLQDHKIIDIQHIQGVEDNYRQIPNSGTYFGPLYRDVAGTLPLRFSFTPSVDAWWELTLHIGIMYHASTDVWRYMYGAIEVTPAALDTNFTTGATNASYSYQLVQQVNTGRTYSGRSINDMFKLSAGVTYRASGYYSGDNTGGTWYHHCYPGYLWLHGTAYEA